MNGACTGNPTREAAAAKGDALRYLTRRARSGAQVRRRLQQRGHPRDVVDEVIAWLKGCGYLEDKKFAEDWIESRKRTRPSGRLRLSRELREQGVIEEHIDAALERLLPEEVERDLALELGASRISRYRDVSDEVARRRLGGLLTRRGFPAEVISDVLRTVIEPGRTLP